MSNHYKITPTEKLVAHFRRYTDIPHSEYIAEADYKNDLDVHRHINVIESKIDEILNKLAYAYFFVDIYKERQDRVYLGGY